MSFFVRKLGFYQENNLSLCKEVDNFFFKSNLTLPNNCSVKHIKLHQYFIKTLTRFNIQENN